MSDELEALARRLGAALQAQGLAVATAESCTGGWVAKSLTDVAGSSAWFERGFVTYSNVSKQELLGVLPATIERHGAVSEETVREMVAGALARSHAQLAVAITGIAGPGGGSLEKPVGTVWLAWAGTAPERWVRVRREQFSGDRAAVRRQAVVAALTGLIDVLAGHG